MQAHQLPPALAPDLQKRQIRKAEVQGVAPAADGWPQGTGPTESTRPNPSVVGTADLCCYPTTNQAMSRDTVAALVR